MIPRQIYGLEPHYLLHQSKNSFRQLLNSISAKNYVILNIRIKELEPSQNDFSPWPTRFAVRSVGTGARRRLHGEANVRRQRPGADRRLAQYDGHVFGCAMWLRPVETCICVPRRPRRQRPLELNEHTNKRPGEVDGTDVE